MPHHQFRDWACLNLNTAGKKTDDNPLSMADRLTGNSGCMTVIVIRTVDIFCVASVLNGNASHLIFPSVHDHYFIFLDKNHVVDERCAPI